MCHWYKCQSLDMIFGVLCDDTLPPYPEEESGHYSLSTPDNAGQGVFLLCMGPAGTSVSVSERQTLLSPVSPSLCVAASVMSAWASCGSWPLPPFQGLWTEHQRLSICLLVSSVGLQDDPTPTDKQGPTGPMPIHSTMRMPGRKEGPRSPVCTVELYSRQDVGSFLCCPNQQQL